MSSRFDFARQRRRRKSRWLIWLTVAFLAFLSVGVGVSLGFFLVSDQGLPQISSLEDQKPSIITKIRCESGEVIGEFAQEKRIILGLDQIPPHMIHAIISVEDAHFYTHPGVDVLGILRAALENLKAGRVVQGGSTLTQQLAKLLFLTPERSLSRKIKEAILALQIERRYSKDEILEFYCNQIYMGHNRYGLEAASLFYFGKHIRDVNLEEAAMLAGIPQWPSIYSPFKDMEAAVRRRNHVLDRMAEEGYISVAQAEEAKNKPITLNRGERDTVFVAPYFVEEVRQYLEKNFGAKGLYRDGLDVYTTLDLSLQKNAEKALRKGLTTLDKRQGFRKIERNALDEGATDLQQFWLDEWNRPLAEGDIANGVVLKVDAKSATVKIANTISTVRQPAIEWTNRSRLDTVFRVGTIAPFEIRRMDKNKGEMQLFLEQEPIVEGSMVVVDQKTGAIKAMVGGYSFERSRFNRSVQALRQTGSAFKPFVYAAAFANGFTPADTLFDEPISIVVDSRTGEVYAPENYDKEYHGLTTLRVALEKSRNTIAVMLLQKVGYHTVIDFARRCGISEDLKAYPSLALGAFETTLLELTSAYGVFGNGGTRVEPFFIHYIKDRDGDVIMRNQPIARQVITKETAYLITSVLEGVVKRGTAVAARNLPWTLAGKTGTTDDYADAWFIGYSPTFCAGVWVGFDIKKTLGDKEVGARAALPIWIDYVEGALEGQPNEPFPKPDDIIVVPIDAQSGLLAGPNCGRVIEESFIRGTEPITYCSESAHTALSQPYYMQRQGAAAPPEQPADTSTQPPSFRMHF
jgi:penicillin-binding protein 1A